MPPVNEILKQRRIELDMTMHDVAKIVGVSEGTISRWESGDIANMRRDRISLLSKALQLSPAVIMGWEEPETTIVLSQKEYNIIMKYRDNIEMQVAVDTLLGVGKEYGGNSHSAIVKQQ